jgi:ABC-type phosphate transport system permease subunit
MKWHVIFGGMLDDPYIDRVWILLVLSLVSSLISFYRYKFGYAIILIIGIASAIFLSHFLERETYRQITTLSDSMPRLLAVTIGSFVLPIIATYWSWRRLRNKHAALA